VPTLRLCVLYGSQNKQQLLPYETSRDWFLQPKWRVFTARYALSPYIKQIRFVFKGLISPDDKRTLLSNAIREERHTWKASSRLGDQQFPRPLCDSKLEIFALLGCYTTQIGSWLPTFRESIWIPSSMVKKSNFFLDCLVLQYVTDRFSRNVRNWPSMLHKIPKEWRSHLHRGGSLKTRKSKPLFCCYNSLQRAVTPSTGKAVTRYSGLVLMLATCLNCW
jgi:hypothetical protein